MRLPIAQLFLQHFPGQPLALPVGKVHILNRKRRQCRGNLPIESENFTKTIEIARAVRKKGIVYIKYVTSNFQICDESANNKYVSNLKKSD